MKDNSGQVLSQMEKNIGKALTRVGMKFQEIATLEANKQIYDTPPPKNYVRTGHYRSKMGYEPDISNKQVIVYNNAEYAPYIENGTVRMRARPIIRDSVMNYIDEYQEIVTQELGDGFTVHASM
jgi:HK97 gp10 family phage protein